MKRIDKSRKRTVLRCEALEERTLMTVGVIGAFPTELVLSPTPPPPPAAFASFLSIDASHDDSPNSFFAGGALRIDYNMMLTTMAMLAPTGPGGGNPPPPPPPSVLDHVSIEIWQGSTKLAERGHFTSMNVTSGLVNLADVYLVSGSVQVNARAYFTNGSTNVSTKSYMLVKSGQVINGDFTAQTFDISTFTGDGVVIHGKGGTDVLKLNALGSTIASINGTSLSAFSPTAGGQAIYKGMAMDSIRLTNGREFYVTGIERLEVLSPPARTMYFAYGPYVEAPIYVTQTINLMVNVNDTNFANQWNLHVTDVADAWRFTKGSSQILLVSLDTGVLTTATGGGAITGINTGRLITDATDNDNTTAYGHGHKAISVMAATANDASFHAGINWVSNVFVADVYNGVSLQAAIQAAFDYADARGMKIVFQGGIQGESWLTSGGTQAQLEALIQTHTNRALFSIAAGNGGPGGNLTDPNFMTSVSGVAKLESNHANVMAVGALQRTSTTASGFSNASAVDIASYSNRGSNLTMMAPTDSPATDFFGASTFGGTSCANPNMAAMASLVWSANPNLTAVQVRNILQSTAMDLGTTGEDNTFGSGLVDVGTAVRRAVALARDFNLANLVGPIGPIFTSNVLAGQAMTSSMIAKAPDVESEVTTAPSAETLAALDVVFATPQTQVTMTTMAEHFADAGAVMEAALTELVQRATKHDADAGVSDSGPASCDLDEALANMDDWLSM